MRLATFTHAGTTRAGRVEGEEIIDLSEAGLPGDVQQLLAAGPEALAKAGTATGTARSLESVRLAPPIPAPQKFFGIGLNYGDHIEETGMEKPTFPMFFNKQSSCVSGPGDPIHRPRASETLDYEGELGLVIGRRCRHVPESRAAEVIAGYCVVNDVSVRDWQMKAKTFVLGKGWDTHGPHGPWLTTSDEVGDPHSLALRTWVNGELRQDSNTKHLIFDCYNLVATVSTMCTLEPGDIISTGTPSGVALGFKPPKWLVPGDTVRIEIEKLGVLENSVIDEPPDNALL